VVFAEAAGCREAWAKALVGWNVVESQVVKKWQSEAKAATLLRLLKLRYGALPTEVESSVRQTQQAEQLDRWLDAVVTAATLEQFRHDTGL